MTYYRDKWFRLGSVILSALVVTYTNSLVSNPSLISFGRAIVAFLGIVIICETTRLLVYKRREWFTSYYGNLLAFLGGVAWTTLILFITVIIKGYISTGKWDSGLLIDPQVIINGKKIVMGVVGNCLLNAFFLFPFLFGTYEYFYHAGQLRINKLKNERLERDKLKAELQQLKGIVNPHFLFNNLNSLSSLMSEDVQQAQDFLDELTRVFRYLLRNNDTDLTTLDEELKFIQSYCHLLQTRHSQCINMVVNIRDEHRGLLIPPLTLQLLIENAVKHNMVSKSSPLTIELLSDSNNTLVVRNNVQLKKVLIESTGIGLQSIQTRYRMLNKPGIEVQKNNNFFAISIQLIEPEKSVSEA